MDSTVTANPPLYTMPAPQLPVVKMKKKSKANEREKVLAIVQVLDDYRSEDLRQILVRNELYLPRKCTW